MSRSLALVLLLAAGPAFAQATSMAPPAATGAARVRPVKPAATPVDAIAESARREAEARERRWDERMKRVTRSMCTGC